MSESKRLTHMMIESVNERVTDTRKMVTAGIFLVLAFSAATFGLTLGAAEFAKESHVTVIEGNVPIVTDDMGEIVKSGEPAMVKRSLNEILCNGVKTRAAITAAVEKLRKYTYLDEDHNMVTMQVVGFMVHKDDSTVTLRGAAGESVTITRDEACETVETGRKLLQYGYSNDSYWSYSGSNSGSNGGTGGGSGSGGGSSCKEDGEKEDGSKISVDAPFQVSASLKGFYDSSVTDGPKPPKKVKITSFSAEGISLKSALHIKDDGWITASAAFDQSVCETDDWQLSLNANAAIDVVDTKTFDNLLNDPSWKLGGGFDITLDGTYGTHELSAGVNLKGTGSEFDAGWYAKYKYELGDWKPTSGYPAPSAFRVVIPDEFELGVSGGQSGTTLNGKIFYRF